MTLNFGLTRISVSFWFALSITIIIIYDTEGVASIAFLSALLHEVGHIVVFAIQKQMPREICFTPFGLTLKEGNCGKLSYKNEIQAALGGPLVNFVFCILALIVMFVAKTYAPLCLSDFIPHIQQLLYVNSALFIFNMLPVNELDGGRALKALLSLKCTETFAARIETLAGTTTVSLLFATLFILAAYGIYNFSLFLATFYLGILVFFRGVLFPKHGN